MRAIATQHRRSCSTRTDSVLEGSLCARPRLIRRYHMLSAGRRPAVLHRSSPGCSGLPRRRSASVSASSRSSHPERQHGARDGYACRSKRTDVPAGTDSNPAEELKVRRDDNVSACCPEQLTTTGFADRSSTALEGICRGIRLLPRGQADPSIFRRMLHTFRSVHILLWFSLPCAARVFQRTARCTQCVFVPRQPTCAAGIAYLQPS